jgi:hypothetical protein
VFNGIKVLRYVLFTGHRAPTCDLSMSRSFSISVPKASIPERMVLYMTELGKRSEKILIL